MKKGTGKSNIDIVKDYLAGERPFVQVGYTGDAHKHRNEGEKWKDSDGIEWHKKDGKVIKLTKTQGDIIREAIGNRKCKCGLEVRWGNKFDQLFFSKTGMCQDCIIEYESRLRVVGLYPAYETYKIVSNEIGFLKDAKAKLKEVIDYFSKNSAEIEVLCNSEGFIEKFHGTNKEQILKDAKTDLKLVSKRITELTKIKDEAKKDLTTRAAELKIELYV